MKSILVYLFISVALVSQSFAGGFGADGGGRPEGRTSFYNAGGGGGGRLPELVRTLKLDNTNEVVFSYKNNSKTEILNLRREELDSKILNILEKSHKTQSWEQIPTEL
jgi:hypothetical protein